MMTRGVCTMIKTTILLLTLVLLNVVFAAYIPSVETPARGLSKIRRSLPKLCSTALSNTLAIVCRDHGYNEPFSHSENQQRYSLPGPGLVDECCYHSCTIQQLQQYCKAPSEKKSDIIVVPNHSHRLEDQSHSYSTSMTDRQSKPSPRAEANSGDSADVGVKCKNMKRERHRETRIRNNVCKGKNDGKKRHHRGRHCRCRRRCLECRQAGKINGS